MKYYPSHLVAFLLLSLLAFVPLVVCAGVHPANPILPEKSDAKTVRRLEAFLAEGERALAERLLMHWNTHATDVFVRDQAVVRVGGAKAPEPTVVFAGNRSHVTNFKRPKIEDLPRKGEDARGLYLAAQEGCNFQWVPYGQTGCMVNSLNNEIVGLAKNAAFEYARTGDERFARQAWAVLDTYLAGIHYRNVATDLAHGHMQTLFGMQSMETIHDGDILRNVVALYDYLYNWAKEHHPDRLPLLQDALRKWAQVQVDNGVADNNWDMMQLNNILDIALVLEPNAAYADGKGREHFIDVVLNQSSVRNLSVTALAEKGFDPETGIWFECPGYSQVVLNDYAHFADKCKRLLDIDLFEKIPVLKKAFAADGEYLFPDGMILGFGDTHPAPLKADIVKYGPQHSSPFFHAPNASWLVSRSGMDPTNDIAFALNGALGNHMHANGISLELYAKGYRLGPDAGIGWKLYSGEDYQEYYGRWMAHNTVMVNSRSNHGIMKVFQPFKLVAHGEEWATVSYREPAGARQQRTFARVGADYFVDCFRSRLGTGEKEWHDYYYHNLADKLTLNGEVAPTDEIAFVESGLYGLSYIQDKFARKGTGDLVAQFDWARPEGNVDMTVYMNGNRDRTFIQALAPATEGLSRVKHYNIDRNSRTPTLVVRQRGEAWTTPFLAVFDPKHVVAQVAFTANTITVTRKDGRVDTHTFAENGDYQVSTCAAREPVFKNDGVYQWSVASAPPDADRKPGRAYLWIPETCSRLRGVVVGQQNMLEEPIFATPAFRTEMAKAQMGIVFIAPIQCGIWHFTADESKWLVDILDRLADVSGYDELKAAPVAFIGHSAMAMWPYFGAATWGDRAICGISLKGAWADMSKDWAKEPVGKGLAGVPFLLLDGEYEDAHGRGERSLAFCAKYPDVPFSFCAEDGAGHFDWSDELAAYLGLYIRKAACARFPNVGAPKARFVAKKGGVWLPLWRRYAVEAPAVPSAAPLARGYWFFDAEMALATVKLQERFRAQTKTPLVSLAQEGAVIPQRKTHLQVHPTFKPVDGPNGVRFTLNPVFIEDVEEGRLADWTGLPAGAKAPHPASDASLFVQLICGPAIRVGKDAYEVRLDRGSVYRDTRDVTLQAIFPGDETYQRTVQQASMSLPQPKGAGNGKTYHFVREGAATVDDEGRLTFLPLPPRAKKPHVVTVCDWEWSAKPPVFREVAYPDQD